MKKIKKIRNKIKQKYRFRKNKNRKRFNNKKFKRKNIKLRFSIKIKRRYDK